MDSETLEGMEKANHNQQQKKTIPIKRWLLILNCILTTIGQVGGPLLLRLYFLHGGKRKWFTSWIQTIAFPIILFPISISYIWSKADGKASSKFLVGRKLLAASAVMGFFFALDSYLYAFGLSYLPVSTSALLLSTQMAFTALFAFLIVKQKFTFYSINAVILMSLGAVVLGVHASSDRPPGVSNGRYYMGFFMTLAAAALFGLELPLIETIYSKACKAITFPLVMQVQFLVGLFATIFCTIAMIINKDFQAISREAQEYGLGESKYYMILVWTAIAMQLLVIGNMGVIFCSTSLFSGIFMSLLVPVQEIFAVIFFHEKFTAEKGLALAMCLWGFASYFYGEHRKSKEEKAATIETGLKEKVDMIETGPNVA
ncbi:purine permease 1-like [Magnolia sinica]|uniref:purine permease 1-like n=1 Tax=Magnolia sinica TaxID=86752 RepID=UPI00265B045F|nr:purine permease 1-like [Magnolia sinica]